MKKIKLSHFRADLLDIGAYHYAEQNPLSDDTFWLFNAGSINATLNMNTLSCDYVDLSLDVLRLDELMRVQTKYLGVFSFEIYMEPYGSGFGLRIVTKENSPFYTCLEL